MKRFPILLFLIVLFAGCAARIPEAIREAPETALTPLEASRGPAPVGVRVRWGGTIAAIENRETDTWLEIVARPLGDDGRPIETDQSQGRFLARLDQFVDPAVYRPGREITVIGELQENLQGTVGDFPYTFPVLDVERHYLWPERRLEYAYRPVPYDPFWDPYWYDPWYPWGWRSPFRYYPYYPYFP